MKRALALSVVAGTLAFSGALVGDEPKRAVPPAPLIAEATPTSAIATISDRELSLYPGSLFEVPNPAGFTWTGAEPGDNELLPRAFVIAPPRIPHAIADFMPVTLRGASANACLDCHALDAGAGAPELPASHRTDLRNSPADVGANVTGARFLCLACHVATTDAKAARTSRLPAP